MQEIFIANSPISNGLFVIMMIVTLLIAILVPLSRVKPSRNESKEITEKYPLGSRARKLWLIKFGIIFSIAGTLFVFFMFSTMYGVSFLHFTLHKLNLLEFFHANFGYMPTYKQQ